MNAAAGVRRGVLSVRVVRPIAVAVVLTIVLASAAGAGAASFTVSNTADSGPGSLRQAVLDANANPGADTITFGVTGTITLTSGDLVATDHLTIDGPGAASLTVSGNNTSRVLRVNPGVTLNVEDLTIADGFATGPDEAGNGGGILNFFGTLTVTNTTFSGNTADGISGGAIVSYGNDLTVAKSTFSDNFAHDSGGGIAGGALTVTDSTFSGNSTATGSGGGIVAGGDTIDCSTPVTVTSSTFTENSSGAGAGISIGCANLTVTNSTFDRNSAGFFGGGGILALSSTVTVTNSTFFGNSTSPFGAAIHTDQPAAVTLRNTLVSNNASPGGQCPAGVTDGGGNLSWPDSTCPGINADPLLDPAGLQDNGGPTPTIALQPGSPAIDAAVLANCPPTDQRGVPRPFGAGCDIGAFELANSPPSCASAVATPDELWPPNHKLAIVTLSGATDPDGDVVTLTVTAVTQDEPVSSADPGDVAPDAQAGPTGDTVFVRAERSDTGDGRVYRISFTGNDGAGGTCSGTATVGVPRGRHSALVDSAPPSYDSFGV